MSEAISNVIAECGELFDLGVRDLEEVCDELATNQDRYVPRLSEGVVNLVGGASPLLQLQELVSNPLFTQKENFSEFANFLEELVGTAIITATSSLSLSHNFNTLLHMHNYMVTKLIFIPPLPSPPPIPLGPPVLQPECACEHVLRCLLW